MISLTAYSTESTEEYRELKTSIKCESSAFGFRNIPIIVIEWVLSWVEFWIQLRFFHLFYTLNLIEWKFNEVKSDFFVDFQSQHFTLKLYFSEWTIRWSWNTEIFQHSLWWIQISKNVKWIWNVWIWFDFKSLISWISKILTSAFHFMKVHLSSNANPHTQFRHLHYLTHLIATNFLREMSKHVAFSIIFCHHRHHHHDYYYHWSSHRHLCIGNCTSHLPNNKLKWRL